MWPEDAKQLRRGRFFVCGNSTLTQTRRIAGYFAAISRIIFRGAQKEDGN